jgi:hypothetical protein
MLFGARRSRDPHAFAVVRDIVEVVAIVAAGIWAFYVFAYENRIKPSLADPNVDVSVHLLVRPGIGLTGDRAHALVKYL